MEVEISGSSPGLPVSGSNLAYLVWENLSVVLPSKGGDAPTRRILHGLNGYCEPCRILAVMGPSGSGKSTLLDALAGRLTGNVIQTGDILLNGRKMRPDYGLVAYVTQENEMLGTLTVRETVTYSAHLRLPSTLSKVEIEEMAESTIVEMGLQDCADRSIGNWHLRGISGGEKKRLSIALEILTRPRILFLDEPTSGLDSAAAFSVIQTLKSIAVDGKTVIFSIHQPSSEVVAVFDDLYLLSGGESVYFGDAKLATEFFAEAGFPCPSRRNPADHFLRCINSDFDLVTATMRGSSKFFTCLDDGSSADPLLMKRTAEIKAALVAKYRSSTYSEIVRRRMREIFNSTQGLVEERSRGSHASWWKQLTTLTRRSSLNMSRDIGYYWFRVVVYIVVAICVGTIFFNVGNGKGAVLARGSCGGFISGFMTFMSIGGFPSFAEEMKVFYAERLNGHYGVAAYTLSNFLSSFPFLVLLSSSSGSIAYYMVKFRPGFEHFFYFVLTLFGTVAVVESIMMVVAALVPNFLMGIITGAGIMGIMMLTAGFFRLLPDLPKPVWRYPLSYLSYGSWALQGQYKNDMLGLMFDPILPTGGPQVSGEYIMNEQLGIGTSRSKWLDLAALFFLMVIYRCLFFLMIKLKERSLPQVRKMLAKRKLRRLQKRPSFSIKPPSLPSSRRFNPNPIPLSSQEGLSSPIT